MWCDDKWTNHELEEELKRNPLYLEDVGPSWMPGYEASRIIDGQGGLKRIKDYPDAEEEEIDWEFISNHGKLYDFDVFDHYPEELKNELVHLKEAEDELRRLTISMEDTSDMETEVEEIRTRLKSYISLRKNIHDRNECIEEAVKGYFNGGGRGPEDPSEEGDTDVVLEEYRVKGVTDNTITIGWKINESYLKSLNHVRIFIPGVCHAKIKDHREEYTINNLYPGSEYKITLIVVTGYREVLYNLNTRTDGKSSLGGGLPHKLVGKTFTERN